MHALVLVVGNSDCFFRLANSKFILVFDFHVFVADYFSDGKCLACMYRAKFIEISVGINHNVDELLVGILTQIRLKSAHYDGKEYSSQQWYKSRGVVRASMKARQMFTWIFGKEDTKFKNCENLQIL